MSSLLCVSEFGKSSVFINSSKQRVHRFARNRLGILKGILSRLVLQKHEEDEYTNQKGENGRIGDEFVAFLSIRSDLEVLPNDIGWLGSISDLKLMTKRHYRSVNLEFLVCIAFSIIFKAIVNASLFSLLTGESDKSTYGNRHFISVLLDKFSDLLIFFNDFDLVSIISDETSTLGELLDQLSIVISNSNIGNLDLSLI